ncbi:hypothetical protein GmHk_19G053818 [Glycine max]|nr:hypothetical protein GmHk_19G053818 [Glycine max]
MKLICDSHNHELAKSLVGHPYVGRLTKDEKIIVVNMKKSMVKSRNILLTLKEHNVNNSIYKTNNYMLSLLDIFGVTPTRMSFYVAFAYLEGEHLNNVFWALQRYQGLFLRCDAFLGIIAIDRDLALVNAVKIVFLKTTNLLCQFHIDKNVKAKCKTLAGKNNAWDYVMEAWGSLVYCPSEQEFDECFKKFEIACSPWPMFVDYVNQTWLIPHKEMFVKA